MPFLTFSPVRLGWTVVLPVLLQHFTGHCSFLPCVRMSVLGEASHYLSRQAILSLIPRKPSTRDHRRQHGYEYSLQMAPGSGMTEPRTWLYGACSTHRAGRQKNGRLEFSSCLPYITVFVLHLLYITRHLGIAMRHAHLGACLNGPKKADVGDTRMLGGS